MFKFPRFKGIIFLIPLLILLLINQSIWSVTAAADNSASTALQQAWALARASGTYNFTTDVEQTLIPRALPHMIGASSEQLDFRVEGRTELPEKSTLSLRIEGAEPINFIQIGDQVFIQENGELRLADTPQAGGLTSNDYLGYLVGAENVMTAGIKSAGGERFHVFTFDIDGAKIARHQAQQRLQPGQTIMPVPEALQLTGQGELWVDAAGLPRRQILDLYQPATASDYDTRINLVADFSQFGTAVSITAPEQTADGSYVLPGGNDSPTGATSPTTPTTILNSMNDGPTRANLLTILALAVICGAYFLLFRRWPRPTYVATIVTIVGSMLFSPLLETAVAASLQAQNQTRNNDFIQSLGVQTVKEPLFNNDPATIQCGDGLDTTSSDTDSLSDFVENCYGTNPYQADTDYDGVPDDVELTGISFAGRTWISDPLQPDTNHDGLTDGEEWLFIAATATRDAFGSVAAWDIDGDNVPNPWDADNDNDGVLDEFDLSPYSTTPFISDRFTLNSLGGDEGNLYHYLDIQVQPQNPQHLRYTLSTLDWPDDEEGNIQDLDQSTADLRVLPMLAIHTPVVPDADLAQKYGLTILPDPAVAGGYLIYAPLSPNSDGGQITSFQTRLAYGPNTLNNTSWEMEVVWMLQGTLDSYRARNEVKAQLTPLTTYKEDSFRVTGYRMVRSGQAEVALLATPTEPTDDAQLFRLLFGLQQTFLSQQSLAGQSSQRNMLAEIEYRFSATNNTPLVEKWGVEVPVAISLPTAYGHQDEMRASLSQVQISPFLNANFGAVNTASLLIASEDSSGVLTMDDLAQGNAAVRQTANWTSADLVTNRALNLNMYSRSGSGRWTLLDYADMLDVVDGRYTDYSAALSILQSDYPDLTATDLTQVLTMFYGIWHAGEVAISAVSGNPVLLGSGDDVAINASLEEPNDHNLPVYLTEIGQLANPGQGLAFGKNPVSDQQFLATRPTASFTGVSAGSINLSVDSTQVPYKSELSAAYKTFKIFSKSKNAYSTYFEVKDNLIKAYVNGTGTLDDVFSTSKIMTGWRSVGIGDAVGLVIEVAVIWAVFALTTDFDNPFEVGEAVAFAVVSTVWAVVTFILALNPITAIFALVFAVFDLLFYAIFGISILQVTLQAVSDFFYNATELSEVKDLQYGSFSSSLRDENLGMVVGNTFIVDTDFRGEVTATSDGNGGDAANSYLRGRLSGAGGVATNVDKPCVVSATSTRTYVCENDTSLAIPLLTAGKDIRYDILAIAKARVIYEEAVFIGIKWKDHRNFDVPEDAEKIPMYLDVLPNSLDGLWNWTSVVTNHDTDFDGLTDDREATVPGLNPNNWDTDGDQLSDKFELETGSGFDPLNADGDGDGLDDRAEWKLGTDPANADSDGDGLLDGEEVLHYDAVSGQWVGGWVVMLSNNGAQATLFSDPLQADADGDGLNDFAERANGTSPHAYNAAPQLAVAIAETADGPDNRPGVYVEPGDTLQFPIGLLNFGPQKVSRILNLCVPDIFDPTAVLALQGDRTIAGQSNPPAPNCPNGQRLSWDFGGSANLRFGEQVSATFALTIDSGLTASTAVSLTAHLPYDVVGMENLYASVPVVVDVDDPTLSFLAPADDSLWLGSDTTAYVIGGIANDPTTWIDTVSLNVSGSGPLPVVGAEIWAATWQNFSDGQYTLTASASDYVGRSSGTATRIIRVDHTPPQVSTSLTDGTIVSGQQMTSTILIPLNGTANDVTAGGVQSGIERVQLSLDGRPWRETAVSGNTWSVDWQLANSAAAQGEHDLQIRAFDVAGNVSAIVSRTIIVDVVEPTSDLTNSTFQTDFPTVPVGVPYTVRGVADDAGNAPEPVSPAVLAGSLDSIGGATAWFSADFITDDDTGLVVQWLGDMNGDRLADYVVGLPNAADGNGMVAVMYGRAGDWTLPPDMETFASSRSTLVGQPGAPIGQDVSPIGDVNGDGFDDLLIGVVAQNEAFLILGAASDLGREQALATDHAAIVRLEPAGGDSFNGRFRAAGDVNGDGYADFFVGLNNNRTALIAGQANWLNDNSLAANLLSTITTPAGTTIAGVGDPDGDNYDDFVLMIAADQAYFFAGSAVPPLTLETAAATRTLAAAGDQIAALGDVNGDGYDDFLLSDPAAYQLVFGANGSLTCCLALAGTSSAINGFVAAVGNVRDTTANTAGLNDILVGNAAGDAYLIIGSTALNTGSNLSGFIGATFTGVANAASTYFAGGADANADGSSDLLLLPSAAAAVAYGFDGFPAAPFIPLNLLPAGAPVGSADVGARSPLATLEVDDDGCATCGYTTIQAAVNAAAANDTIVIYPGVYAGFTVSNKQNVTIQGVNADAVFVDGGGGTAVTLNNSNGVTLANMTIRNSQTALRLTNSGVGGYANATLFNHVDQLLLLDFSQQAIRLDRFSTLEVTQSTIVGSGSNPYIAVDASPFDSAFTKSWNPTSRAIPTQVRDGAQLVPYNASNAYVLPGNGTTAVYTYDASSNALTGKPAAPGAVTGGSAAASIGNDLYALTADHWQDVPDVPGNRSIKEIEVDGDEIFVVTSDNHLYWYNGSSWIGLITSLSGTSPYIEELALANDLVLVGGRFDQVNGSFSSANVVGWQRSTQTFVNMTYSRVPVTAIGAYGTTIGMAAEGGRIYRWTGSAWRVVSKAYVNSRDGYTAENGLVDVIAIAPSGWIYIGGTFSSIANSCNEYTHGGIGCGQFDYPSNIAYARSWGRFAPVSFCSNCGHGIFGPNVVVKTIDFSGRFVVVGGQFEEAGVDNAYTSVGGNYFAPTASRNVVIYDKTAPSHAQWIALPNQMNGIVNDVLGVDDAIYVAGTFTNLGGLAANGVARWTFERGWEPLGSGVNNRTNLQLATSQSTRGPVYIGGAFTTVNGQSHPKLVKTGSLFHRFNNASQSWSPAAQLPVAPYQPVTIIGGAANDLYALAGQYSGAFGTWGSQMDWWRLSYYGLTRFWLPKNEYALWHYQAALDSWLPLSPISSDLLGATPVPNANDGWDAWAGYIPKSGRADSAKLVQVDGDLYALLAGIWPQLFHYDRAADSWTELAQPPTNSLTWGDGASLTWDGNRYLYATAGANGRHLLRYDLVADFWRVIADGSGGSADVPFNVQPGSQLATLGDRMVAMSSVTGQSSLHRFGPVGNYAEKLIISDTLFVAPEQAATANWVPFQPVFGAPDDFAITLQANNQWVGGTLTPTHWTITPTIPALTFAAADFTNPAEQNYHLGADHTIDAGYTPYAPNARVALTGCAFDDLTCFTTIQAAINSGAQTVQLDPGHYQERFYLLQGTTLLGSQAETTLLSAPDALALPLVKAEGVQSVNLGRVTLLGSGNTVGFQAEDGTVGRFFRSIGRVLATAVSVDGTTTQIEIYNNTFSNNTNGVAATNCAPVDVRNTIFHQQSGIGLQYESCAATINHRYNLYNNNGTDLQPNTGEPGAVFADPLFVDAAATNYRLQANSPAIDGGDPSDPVPPGGTVADIGYAENGQASFSVSQSYCETCANDGLIWQVDAFATIQTALDAAGDALQQLRQSYDAPYFTVGVGPGVYSETVQVPSYVRLQGSGVDQTTLRSISGPLVTFAGASYSELSHFRLDGNGALTHTVALLNASNHITVTRNLLLNAGTNKTAVYATGQSSGLIRFNTLVNNQNSVQVNGPGAWLEVENNILSGGLTGFHALNSGVLLNDYNLLDGITTYYGGTAVAGLNDITGRNPLFIIPAATNFYRLQPASPAVDAANPQAPVPTGGGLLADIGYRELQARPVTLFLGDSQLSKAIANSGVAGVEVGVAFVADPTQPVTATLPTVWQAATLQGTAGDTARYWTVATTPAQMGTYRIYSRASDAVSNGETEPTIWFEGGFVAESPQVNWIAPTGSQNAPLELRAELANYIPGAFGNYTIFFEIDGRAVPAQWEPAPFSAALGAPRTFRTWAPLTTGSHQIKAVVVTSAGRTIESATIGLTIAGQNPPDEDLPFIILPAFARTPATTIIYTDTVTLNGTVGDTGSGVLGVEASFDNGISWLPASVSGNNWALDWQPPSGQTGVSYPVLLRVTDLAGNQQTISVNVIVDNEPPQNEPDWQFSVPEGGFVEQGSALTIDWATPYETDGPATVLMAINQIVPSPATRPTTIATGNQFSMTLNATGAWYAHFAVRDTAGNEIIDSAGPWYVANATAAVCTDRRRAILLDGYLELTNGEWLAGERLDDDERPTLATGQSAQQLYTTWDGINTYVAWQGASWDNDGVLWVYIATNEAGGTTQTVLNSHTLPFVANYALQISGATAGTLWRAAGGSWTNQGAADFAQTDRDIVEARLPFRADDMQLLAYATDDSGAVWSVFPTTNSLTAPWIEGYSWTDTCQISVPNAGQPRAYQIDMNVVPTVPGGGLRGAYHNANYVVQITNHELNKTLSGMQVNAATAPGLFKAGTTSVRDWNTAVAALAPGASRTVAINTRTGSQAELQALTGVTTTLQLRLNGLAASTAQITHTLDMTRPQLTILTPTYLGNGLNAIQGTAVDPGGVARVEYSYNYGSWVAATGTNNWLFNIYAPTSNLRIRAIDTVGNITTQLTSFNIDAILPAVQFTNPGLISTTYALLSGQATDFGPYQPDRSSGVADVNIQIGTDPYQPVTDRRGTLRDVTWHYLWQPPTGDGVTQQLRLQVTDRAGLQTTTNWYTVIIDTVPPQITVTQALSVVNASLVTPPTVLSGQVSDGRGLATLAIEMENPAGDLTTVPITWSGANWHYALDLANAPAGTYYLSVMATDTTGHVTRTPVYPVLVPATPDLALTLAATPQSLAPGDLVTYTTTISNGGGFIASNSALTFTLPAGLTPLLTSSSQPITATGTTVWALPSLAPQTGLTVTLTAQAVNGLTGTQSLPVTAVTRPDQLDLQPGNNHAQTTIVVGDAPFSNVVVTTDAPVNGTNGWKTLQNSAIAFTTTVSGGTNLTYVWDFGDGVQANGPAVSHHFTSNGNRTVVMTVSNGVTQQRVSLPFQVQSPNLSIQQTRTPAAAVPGATVTYTIRFQNLGSIGLAVPGILITDTLPADLLNPTFTASLPVTPTFSAGQIVWALPPLAQYAFGTIVLSGQVPAPISGTITLPNAVAIGNPAGDYAPANDTSLVSLNAGDSAISYLTANATPSIVAQKEPFTLTAQAYGGTNVTYSWDLGDGTTAVGPNVTHAYTTTGYHSPTVTAVNGSSSRSFTYRSIYVRASDLRVSLSGQPDPVRPGDTVTYLINVTNQAQSLLSGTILTVTLPNEVTFITVTSNAGVTLLTPVGNVMAWQLSPISPCCSYNNLGMTLRGTVAPGLTGSVPLTTSVVISHPYDFVASNNTAVTGPIATDGPLPAFNMTGATTYFLGDLTTLDLTLPPGTLADIAWSLGDGTILTGYPITHTYAAPGDYTVVVTATNLADQITATTTVQVVLADLVLSQTPQSATVQSGDTIRYTLAYTNNTPLPLTNIVITDVVGANLLNPIFVGGSGELLVVNTPSLLVWERPYLAAGARGEILVEFTTTSGLLNGVPLTNSVTISAPYPETALANNSVVTVITATERAISGLVVTESGPAYPNDVITLTAVIADGTDVGFAWNIDGVLKSGPVVTTTQTSPGDYSVIFTATNDISQQVVPLTVTVVLPDLQVAKTTAATFAVLDEQVRYTLVYTNNTPLPLAGALLTDILPVQLVLPTFTATPPVTLISGSSPTMTWQLPTLQPYQRGMIQLTAQVTGTAGVPFTNTLLATTPITDALPQNNVATAVVTTSDQVIAGLNVTSFTGREPEVHLMNLPATFTATVSSGTGITYLWDFTDGTTATGATQTHVFTQPGDYYIQVTAVNSASTASAVYLFQVTDLDFSVNMNTTGPTVLAPGELLEYETTLNFGYLIPRDYFLITTVIPIELDDPVFTEKDFGRVVQATGDLTATQTSPTDWLITATADYVRANANGYIFSGLVDPTITETRWLTYSLAIADTPFERDLSNNSDSISKLIVEPLAGATVVNSGPVAIGTPVNFTSAITGGLNTGETYLWDFGDGTTAVGPTATHLYTTTGIYTATVTMKNLLTERTTFPWEPDWLAVPPVVVTTVVTIAQADLQLAVAAPDTVVPGSPLTYTMTITDAGLLPIPDGQLTLTLPAEFSRQSVVATWPITETAGNVWQLGPLSPGSAYSLTVSGVVTTNIVGTVPFTLSAAISTAVPEATTRNNQATHTVVAADLPIIGLSASNDSPTLLRQPVTFSGNQTGGSNPLYEWDFGDSVTALGQTVAHTYAAPGLYTATVTVRNGLSVISQTMPVSVLAAQLAITQTVAPADLATGAAVTYRITLTNQTALLVPGIVITDVFPVALQIPVLVASVPLTATSSTTWQLAPLAAGETAVLTLTATIDSALTGITSFTNTVLADAPAALGAVAATARVTAYEAITGLNGVSNGPVLVNTPATLTATVSSGVNVAYGWFIEGAYSSGAVVTHTFSQPGNHTAVFSATNGFSTEDSALTVTALLPDLALDQTASASGVAVGMPLTVTAVFTNFTSLSVSGAVIGNLVPDFLTGVAINGTHPLTDNGGDTWTLPTLAAGESGVIVVNGLIDAAYPAGQVAHTTVIGNPADDATPLDNAVTLYVNIQPEAITGFTFVQDGPQFRDTAVSFTATVSSGNGVSYAWDFGDGQTANGTVVNHSYVNAGSYTVRVTASNSVSSLSASQTVTIVAADLTLNQQASASVVEAGERLTYTLTFQNNSALPLAGVVITDIVPLELLTPTVSSDIGLTPSGGSPFVWQLPPLAAGATQAITISGQLADGPTLLFTNTAVIASPQREDDLTDNTAAVGVTRENRFSGLTVSQNGPVAYGVPVTVSATIAVGNASSIVWDLGDGNSATGPVATHLYAAPGVYTVTATASNGLVLLTSSTVVVVVETDLALSQTVSVAEGLPGTAVSFTLVFTNNGSLPVSGAIITDSVPADLQNVTVSASIALTQISSAPLTWQLPTLVAGEVSTITLAGTAPATITSTQILVNEAAISSPVLPELNLANNSSDAIMIVAETDIQGLLVSHDGPQAINETVSFTATVATGTQVAYSWDFGDGGTAVGSAATHAYANPGQYTVVVTASNSSSVHVATTSVTIVENDLQISLKASVADVVPGDQLGYTLVYTYASGLPVTGAMVTLALPAELNNVTSSSNPALTRIGTNPLQWALPPLVAGAGGRIVLRGTVATGLTGLVPLTATATIASGQIDHYPANDSASTTTSAHDLPIVGLQANSNSPQTMGNPVQFVALLSEGTHVVYSWDFGDGQNGSGINALHTYTTPGIYTATVTAVNGVGSAMAATLVTVLFHDVQITATAGITQLVPGELFSMTVNLHNAGDYPATALVISATLPLPMTLQGAVSTVTLTPVPGQTAWQIGQLLPGQTVAIALTAQVTYPLATAADVVLAVSVSSGTPDNQPDNNRVTRDFRLQEAPITDLTLGSSGTGYVAGTAVFTTAVTGGSNIFYSWDFGDSLTETVVPLTPGQLVLTQTINHAYSDSGVYTATVVATNTVSTASAQVTVQIYEGDLTITHTSPITSVRPGEWVTYTIAYGNVGDLPVDGIRIYNFYPPELLLPQVQSSNQITQSLTADYVFTLPPLAVGERGWLTVTGQASPAITTTTWFTHGIYINGNLGDGRPVDNFSQQQTAVILPDAPLSLTALSGTAVAENEVATVSGRIVDLDVTDSFSLTIAWGDGMTTTYGYPAGTQTFSETHRYLDNPTAPATTYSVTLDLVDDDGVRAGGQIELAVTNAAPLVTAGPDQSVVDGTAITLTGAFTDPGPLDTHTVVWDLGDGTIVTGSLSISHVYPVTGTYTATLSVYDDDGGFGIDSVQIQVGNRYQIFIPIAMVEGERYRIYMPLVLSPWYVESTVGPLKTSGWSAQDKRLGPLKMIRQIP